LVPRRADKGIWVRPGSKNGKTSNSTGTGRSSGEVGQKWGDCKVYEKRVASTVGKGFSNLSPNKKGVKKRGKRKIRTDSRKGGL